MDLPIRIATPFSTRSRNNQPRRAWGWPGFRTAQVEAGPRGVAPDSTLQPFFPRIRDHPGVRKPGGDPSGLLVAVPKQIILPPLVLKYLRGVYARTAELLDVVVRVPEIGSDLVLASKSVGIAFRDLSVSFSQSTITLPRAPPASTRWCAWYAWRSNDKDRRSSEIHRQLRPSERSKGGGLQQDVRSLGDAGCRPRPRLPVGRVHHDVRRPTKGTSAALHAPTGRHPCQRGGQR